MMILGQVVRLIWRNRDEDRGEVAAASMPVEFTPREKTIDEFCREKTALNVPKSAAAAQYPKKKKRSPFAAGTSRKIYHGKH